MGAFSIQSLALTIYLCFPRAAVAAVRIYLRLHDDPGLADPGRAAAEANGVKLDGLDGVERRKALKKAKRTQERLDKAQTEAAEPAKKAVVGSDGEQKKVDTDPQGVQLLQTKQPLVDAMRFATPLLELSPRLMDGQIVGFHLYLRRSEYRDE